MQGKADLDGRGAIYRLSRYHVTEMTFPRETVSIHSLDTAESLVGLHASTTGRPTQSWWDDMSTSTAQPPLRYRTQVSSSLAGKCLRRGQCNGWAVEPEDYGSLDFMLDCGEGGFLVTVQTENGKVEVEEFGETVLSCKYQVEKDPNPRVEWKKIRNQDVSFVYYDGKIVGSFQGRAVMEGASIRIKKAMLLDSGEYRCEVSAQQDSRPLGEATVSLTVLVPPDVPSCGIPSSVLTGTVVELTCRDRQGTPPSLYRWYKNGVVLPNTPAQDPLFANSSYTLNSSSGTLQFNTVSKGDSGQYQCEASNGVGEPQRCAAKFMQIDDMNVSGIVAAVVVVSLVVSMCGLGVVFAHRQGYFNSEYMPVSQPGAALLNGK
ncbi:JAM2 protein, partial [Polyodon spathula]|nr:JAM2 protein [Polyodon spathula]